MGEARAVSRALRRNLRRGGRRKDVCLRRPNSYLEAEGTGLRIRSGQQPVDEEKAHGAAVASRRVHGISREDIRVRWIRVSDLWSGSVGSDQQCLGVRPGGRFLEGPGAN